MSTSTGIDPSVNTTITPTIDPSSKTQTEKEKETTKEGVRVEPSSSITPSPTSLPFTNDKDNTTAIPIDAQGHAGSTDLPSTAQSVPLSVPSSSTPPQSSPSAPSISLTPATPENGTSEKMSSTQPVIGEASTTSPASPPPSTSAAVPAQTSIENAGTTDKGPSASENTTSTKPSSVAPKPATTPSTSTPATTTQPASASTSTSKPTAPAASRSAPAHPKKHKRKRTGLNRFLLAFGCLSASEIEDDPREVAQREKADAAKQKNASGAGRSGPVKTEKETDKEKRENARQQVETSGTSGTSGTGATTLAETSDRGDKKTGAAGAAGAATAAVPVAVLGSALASGQGKDKEDVVVTPADPVSPPVEETAGVTSAAVQPPGSGSELLQSTPSRGSLPRRESDNAVVGSGASPISSQSTSGQETLHGQHVHSDDEHGHGHESDQHEDDDDGHDHDHEHEHEHEYEMQDEYEEEDRLIAQGGLGIPLDEYGNPAPLLPPIDRAHIGRKCLVLDLDETLLHSSFKMLPSADYIVPVEIESQVHNVYVIKRPGVDRFLQEMGKIYEVVVFTASLSKYADPVLDMLDIHGVVKHRLFRESCYNHKGNYVKDLSQLGRTMETSIIIDNSPASYIFHPNNAVPVSTWFNDPHDTELTDLCPFLADLAQVDDVRGVLDGSL